VDVKGLKKLRVDGSVEVLITFCFDVLRKTTMVRIDGSELTLI
jgi:hypothetical protein